MVVTIIFNLFYLTCDAFALFEAQEKQALWPGIPLKLSVGHQRLRLVISAQKKVKRLICLSMMTIGSAHFLNSQGEGDIIDSWIVAGVNQFVAELSQTEFVDVRFSSSGEKLMTLAA